MSILVAMSSDKSTSWRRHATGISSEVAPFSTAISAIVTALWTGSIEPPRLISPTMIKPPRTLRFKSDVHKATNEATPSFAPDLAASNARSCTVSSCCLGSLSPTNCLDLAYRFCSAKPMLSRNAGGMGLLSTFKPDPGPALTSMR